MSSRLGPYVLLSMLCLSLYLPGMFAVPPVDRDEARFAEATRQMVESGDFIRPRFLSRERFQKPVGIYWLQAVAVILARNSTAIWPYRLPSVAGALAAVLLTYWCGEFLFGAPGALVGACLMASSVLLVVESNLAKTDAALLACVVGAFGCLSKLYVAPYRNRQAPWKYALGFWIAQGIAVLIKGPVLAVITLVSLATLALADCRDRPQPATSWLAALRFELGVPVAFAIVLPWVLAVGFSTHWALFGAMLRNELLPKVLGGHQSHGAPPGYYLLLMMATFWPGSLLAVAGIAGALCRREQPENRFVLAWLAPCWLFFELMPTKLPNYVLPAYPALALLAGVSAISSPSQRCSEILQRIERWSLAAWSAVTIAIAAAIVTLPVAIDGSFDPLSLIPGAAAVVICIAAARTYMLNRRERAVWIALLGGLLVLTSVRVWVLPNIDRLWLSRLAARAISREAQPTDRTQPLAIVGYEEPSIIFLAGSRAQLMEPDAAARFLQQRPQALVLITEDRIQSFEAACSTLGCKARDVWSGEGINYSKGRTIRLHLFRRVVDSPAMPQCPGPRP